MSKRILAIDDAVEIQAVVQISLEVVGGWTALMATSAKEGLVIAEAEQPDAILLDIMLPDMSGLSLCQLLRQNPATQTIPIIFFTADPLSLNPDLMTHVGISNVISKPFDPLRLPAQIAQMLHW